MTEKMFFVVCIQNALQELGITAEELLNIKNIPALVIALTEGADELSLMTSEEVFAQVQEITTKAEGLLTQLSEMTGMSFEEIQAAITEGQCENYKNSSSYTGCMTGVTHQQFHICNMEVQKHMHF